MAEDDLSRAFQGSTPTSFDFDEEAIATLLDAFVETQTGPQSKRVSRPPDPSDAGAQAAQRTVFQPTSRHETLPLVGDDPETKKRRVQLLEALAERAMGSARARLLTSAAELWEQLGNPEKAVNHYERALAADARDVIVLRALRRHAIRREDWRQAAAVLEKEAALELAAAERGSALKLLARIQLSKLKDPAAAEQASMRATELHESDFVAWALTASARLARGRIAGAAEALVHAAERWPVDSAQAVVLLHASQLMEHAGAPGPAKALYERVLALQPSSLAARLGVARAARGLGDVETAIGALCAAAEGASAPAAKAMRRAAAVASRALGRSHEAMSLIGSADDAASLWTLAEAAALAGDLPCAAEALSTEASDQTSEIRAVSDARRARFLAELGGQAPIEGELEQSFESLADEHVSTAATMARADDAARSGDGSTLVSMLERELEQAPETLKTGMALAIAEATKADRLTALLQAEQRMPRAPILARALALVDHEPDRIARRWIDEGDSAEGERSAFAFVMAARLWRGTEAATDALEAALRRRADYWPALWELEERVDSPGVRAKAALAQASLDPANAASHKLRASFWTQSTEERWTLAEATLDRRAPDPLLLEHLFEVAGHATERAGDLMWLGARGLGSVSYLQRAAASYCAAGLPAQAAKVLREACAARPDDHALVVQRKDAELRASEFARLADSAMGRAREATDDAEQLRAFCAMAEVDRLVRRDMQSARLSLQSISEMRPAHVPTARALEWDSLHEQDPQRIRSSARRLLEALPPDSADRLSRHRLIVELLRSDPDILQADIDRLLRSIDDALDADPGLARQVLGAAYAKDDPLLGMRALAALRASLDHEVERGALALEGARALAQIGETERALETLDTARNHPLALEAEARLLHSAKRWEEAATSYQAAASLAKDRRRAASLWREAACIFEEELADRGRALDAWVAAASCDIGYLDVYRRLAALYASEGRSDDLAALTESRIEAGADTPTLVGLLLEKAAQRRQQADLQGVIDALRECLELDPHHFTALKELVDAHCATGDWQGAAEALIRIARLRSNIQEQAWAFSRLAGIYEEHLGDLERAEASLQRVLKLDPGHVETLDRLATVLSLQGKAREAARVLEELVRRAGSDAEERDYRIRLAVAVENAGQRRQAELMLESLRREQPTEPDVILAVADHYDRQGDTAAKAMHLSRAVNDLRSAIEGRPEDEALWTTLVRVLDRRHGPGPASCAASAAIAIGHPPSLFEGDVTNWNEALGEPKLPMSNVVDNLVAPPGIPATLRRLFALCEDSFDKVLPFDAAAWRLRKPSEIHRPLIEEAGAVAEALGISEPHLKVTYVAPSACMPISGNPPTLVIGGNLHETTTPRERVFLFARALKVAATHLAPALRARPQDLDAALLALLHGHEASRARQQEPRELQDLRKKLLKAVARRSRDEVESLVLELRGSASFSTRDVPFAIAELGDRVALTLTGDVPSALDALLKIAGKDGLPADVARLSTIREVPEAWAVVRFAISDAHFEARGQAGVDP